MPPTAASCNDMLPEFELAWRLLRLAVDHWRSSVPTRLILSVAAPVDSSPLLRLPGTVLRRTSAGIVLGKW